MRAHSIRLSSRIFRQILSGILAVVVTAESYGAARPLPPPMHAVPQVFREQALASRSGIASGPTIGPTPRVIRPIRLKAAAFSISLGLSMLHGQTVPRPAVGGVVANSEAPAPLSWDDLDRWGKRVASARPAEWPALRRKLGYENLRSLLRVDADQRTIQAVANIVATAPASEREQAARTLFDKFLDASTEIQQIYANALEKLHADRLTVPGRDDAPSYIGYWSYRVYLANARDYPELRKRLEWADWGTMWDQSVFTLQSKILEIVVGASSKAESRTFLFQHLTNTNNWTLPDLLRALTALEARNISPPKSSDTDEWRGYWNWRLSNRVVITPKGLLIANYPGLYIVSAVMGGLKGDANVTVMAGSRAEEATPNGFSTLRVFPNPWKAGATIRPGIIFSGFGTAATIKIFTLSAHWTKTLQSDGSDVTWSLQNEDGEPVSSGIYFYSVTDSLGETRTGKLVVIR